MRLVDFIIYETRPHLIYFYKLNKLLHLASNPSNLDYLSFYWLLLFSFLAPFSNCLKGSKIKFRPKDCQLPEFECPEKLFALPLKRRCRMKNYIWRNEYSMVFGCILRIWKSRIWHVIIQITIIRTCRILWSSWKFMKISLKGFSTLENCVSLLINVLFPSSSHWINFRQNHFNWTRSSLTFSK